MHDPADAAPGATTITPTSSATAIGEVHDNGLMAEFKAPRTGAAFQYPSLETQHQPETIVNIIQEDPR